MNSSPRPANSSTPQRVPPLASQIPDAPHEEDLALGWECANPALQIDLWGSEAPAQPLQQFN